MEYDNNNKGALWKSHFGDYYTGHIVLDNVEYKINMYPNDKKGNENAPDFRLKKQVPKEDIQESPKQESDPYKDFANEIEVSDQDLPF